MSVDVAAVVERARAAASSPAAEGSSGDRERLKRIAAEFESMLLVQVLKDMRRAGSWEEEGGGDSLGAESLFETIDVELASHLARAKGLGLSRQLEEAFDRMHPTSGDPVAAGVSGTPVIPAPVIEAARAAAARRPVEEQARGANALVSAVRTAVEATVSAPKAVAHLVRPVAGAVTSAFGWRQDPFTKAMKFHNGVDLRAAYGQEVQAAAAGRVVFSGEQGGYGSTVVVQHQDGTRTRYAHLSARLVEKGDTIGAGEPLGRAGRSGRATGTHLHFEVIAADGRRVAPDRWAETHQSHPPVSMARAESGGNPAGVPVVRPIQDRGANAD